MDTLNQKPGDGLQHEGNRSVRLITDKLERPSLDDRSYRVIRLSNELEVLLVHDAETDKASASMDVNVGAFKDGKDMPGLAHSLEHMLFMGTKKYPVENDYAVYLAANGGYSNAYTASTSTNYHFEVGAKPTEGAGSDSVSPFYGALDRFAQFFIEPLFLEETLDRELRAVDSENKKNLQADGWRLRQLDRSLSNPNHPYSNFSTGNFETLKTEPEKRGIDIRSEFIKFHEDHYSANRMKLVVLGRESLDTLEAWVAELFSGVKNKNLPQNRWETEPFYREEDLLTHVFAKPVMDQRKLEIRWPFIAEEELYESQPSRYLCHLLGHEGPGSILAYLKAKGWANSLYSSADPVCPGSEGILVVSIKLTEQGLENYKEIAKVVFQYIGILRSSPPLEWIFQEQKNITDINFKFQQKTPAISFTSHVSAEMQEPLPREWLISGFSRLRKFDAQAISDALSYLRPDNFRIILVSQHFPGGWDQTEKWYGTEYKYEKIPEDFLSSVKEAYNMSPDNRIPELHLPHKNEFVPTKFDVEKKEVKEPAIAPTLIRNDEIARAWYKKDDTFWVPMANLNIKCFSPLLIATSPRNALMAMLYTYLVKDALEEYAYDAELAGLDYSISVTQQAVVIKVSGYNDKLSVLLEKVLVTMKHLVISPERFAIISERIMRNLKNSDFEAPYYQAAAMTRVLVSDHEFHSDDYREELPHITADDVRAFFPQILKQSFIEVFAHGNLYKEDVLKVTKLVENTIKPRKLAPSDWPIQRSLVLEPGANFVFSKPLVDPKNVNHAIEYVLYLGESDDYVLRAKASLFAQIAHEPCFDVLRTKEQLGYVVFSGTRPTVTTIAYRFIVQSERTPEYLEWRIHSFLDAFAKTLKDISETDFESHKQSLINKRLEKMKNLDQESNRLWTQITNESYDFDLEKVMVEHIKPLTRSDILEFFNHYISPSSPHRAKLAVHMKATSPAADSTTDVTETFTKHLASQGHEPQSEALQARLSGKEGILAAIKAHITEDLKIAADTAAGLLEESMKLLSLVPAEEDDEKRRKPRAFVITNIREFRAMLAVSKGPRAARDVTEFEELDFKL